MTTCRSMRGILPLMADLEDLPQADIPGLLSTTQIQEIYGVPPGSWRVYVTRGEAPAPSHRVDRRTPLYNADDVAKWAKGRTFRKRSPAPEGGDD